MDMRKKLLVLPAAAAAAVPLWLNRRFFTSKAMLTAAHALPNSAKKHGLEVDIPIPAGSGWIKPTLHVDIGDALSEVLGYRIEATAFSHYGGFNLSKVHSDFVNPDSEYYQAWVGAYYVFDGDERKRYGFDDDGNLVTSEALDLVEADQRMALGDFGCPNWFPDGRRLRLKGEMTASTAERSDGMWWRTDGKVDTWSGYHRGKFPEGKLPHYWGSGVVPKDAPHPVDNYHPLTLMGAVFLRYRPEWAATCGMFYVIPEYVDNNGELVTKGMALKNECESILAGVTFREGRPPW
jgi:hypothetical protein